MEKTVVSKKQKILIIGIFVVIVIAMFTTYAIVVEKDIENFFVNNLGVDEEVYGNTVFDSTNLDFRPILDNVVFNDNNNVIHIDFLVGGSEVNTIDNVTYHIALADLVVDCELVSPYVKWKLFKNNEFISEGSLDYRFDTIKDGRLVLTPIQQDLKKYSEDKTTYDKFDFYMWISDSCQSEDVSDCANSESQDSLVNKRIQGKVEVELYSGGKKEIVRNPSNTLNLESCIVGEGE